MTGFSFFLWLGFALVLLFLRVDGKVEERNFQIIIEELTPKVGVMDLFDELRCNVTQLNSRSFINCNFRLNQQIAEMQMDSTLDLFRPNKPVIRLYNVHFDACQYLTMSHKNPLFAMFKKKFQTAFNNSLACPLRAVNGETKLKFQSIKLLLFSTGFQLHAFELVYRRE